MKTYLKIFILSQLLSVCITASAKNKVDKIPTLDEIAGKWIQTSEQNNYPSLMNFIGGVQSTANISAFQHLSIAPYYQGGKKYALWDESLTSERLLENPMKNWACELFYNGEPVRVKESKWVPYEILRRTEVDGIDVNSSLRMTFEEKGILIKVTLENKENKSKSFKLSMNAYGRMRKIAKERWMITNLTWNNERDRCYDDFFRASLTSDKNGVILTDKRSDATVAFQSTLKPSNIELLGDGAKINWNIQLKAGEKKILNIVYAVEDSEKEVDAKAKRWTKEFDKYYTEAKTMWEERWRAAFTPNNKYFSGHLPALITEDEGVSRSYYHGVLVALRQCRTNHGIGERGYVTAGPRWGTTLQYFWCVGTWPHVYAMLDPYSLKEHIKKWMTVDFHSTFALEYLNEKEAGPWYAANDWSIFRCMEAYIELTGDREFLKEVVEGKTILQHLEAIATFFVARPLKEGMILADYGHLDNLLECSPSYERGIASLNAANVHMLRKTAEYLKKDGNITRSNELTAKADSMVRDVFTLYEPGEGVWSAIDLKGKRVPIRHCYDYIVVGQSMGSELTPVMKKEMNNFVNTELRTRNWMRAMSLKDPAAPNSDRPDHGPMGSFDGWIPSTVDVMCRLGGVKEAVDFYRVASEVTYEANFSQAHEFVGPESRGYNPIVKIASRGGQDANEGSGAAFADAAITGIFGLQTFGKDRILAPNTPRGFDGELRNVTFAGKQYTIISDDNGLKMKKQ